MVRTEAEHVTTQNGQSIRWEPLGEGRQTGLGSIPDRHLAARLAQYKDNIARRYVSVSPDAMERSLPQGRLILSPKIDGETWFLEKNGSGARLLSPTGRMIQGIALTTEADSLLGDWHGILAGELYVTVPQGRSRVFDLHAAMGGGPAARTERLRWAAFDLLLDGAEGMASIPFPQRAKRIESLLAGGERIHSIAFEDASSPAETRLAYDRIVTDFGAEGLVIQGEDDRIFKVKPWVSIDAAVVGFLRDARGVTEMLLAIWKDEVFQLIGRVNCGLNGAEQISLLQALEPLACDTEIPLTNHHGESYQWVNPTLVVEVRAHEVLSHKSLGEPIRRWAISHDGITWTPQVKRPSISLRDAVFVQVREDKSACPVDIRWDQVSGYIQRTEPPTSNLPRSTLIAREVYTRSVRNAGLAMRKVVAWATNKRDLDDRFPAYAALWTDFSPARAAPLETTLHTAPTQEEILAWVASMREKNITRSWDCVAKTGDMSINAQPTREMPLPEAPNAPRLSIAFARSSSPTFPVVRRRLNALADLGSLAVTMDERGKESWYELCISTKLVAGLRRVTNLLHLIRRWKSIEVKLDGEPLGAHEIDDVINRLEEIRRCWSRRKTHTSSCGKNCPIGCSLIRIIPTESFLSYSMTKGPLWFTLGRFDGQGVVLDKGKIHERIAGSRNHLLDACPKFNREDIEQFVADLPDRLDPGIAPWRLAYHRATGLPAWVWPEDEPLPPSLSSLPFAQARPNTQSHPLGSTTHTSSHGPSIPRPALRSAPSTSYADICGQDAAVRAVRELIELPMRHANLFEAVGARPRPGAVILAGPPGTGKTLLARAVAAQSGAHLELVAGPELLSPYVGASERALRDVFDRATQSAPSIIVFDELDAMAPARHRVHAHHDQTLVAQLLSLLDGLEPRKAVFVLATTNRPQAIDLALRRPGRFDQIVHMRLPNRAGRAAILRRHLEPLKLDGSVDRDRMISHLASQTKGASGADLSYLCQTAVRLFIRQEIQRREDAAVADESSCATQSVDDLSLRDHHFQLALQEWMQSRQEIRSSG